MKRAVEILVAALLLIVLPVIASHPFLPRPFLDVFDGTALAVQPDEILPDAMLEARARAISAGLRCLVCQNQSIDDSEAGLAKDLRLVVRDRLKTGDSDEAVVDYVVARYGEFVLLKPRLELSTLLLWGTPILLLLCSGTYALWAARRGDAARHPATLSEAEERAVEKLLSDRLP